MKNNISNLSYSRFVNMQLIISRMNRGDDRKDIDEVKVYVQMCVSVYLSMHIDVIYSALHRFTLVRAARQWKREKEKERKKEEENKKKIA